jgi:hypothetical protein
MTAPLGLSPSRMLTVEESLAGQAEWDAYVTRTAARWRILRRCWNCMAPWTPDGQCPTKGCRGPGSGFERLTFPEAPCRSCGQPTQDWYAVGALFSVSRSEFAVEAHWPICPACEQARNVGQAQVVAANAECYPHLREAAQRFLEAGP